MKPGPEPVHPLLIIDTASPTTVVGLGRSDDDWHWLQSDQESGISLFQLVARLTREYTTPLTALRTLAYCEGPGSMLGIRTTAMAIRTWVASGSLRSATPATYSSLALAAAGVRRRCPDDAIAVAIDARRQSWYGLIDLSGAHQPAEIERIPNKESDRLGDRVFLPEGFPIWNRRPEGWQDCSYEPSLLECADQRLRLLRPVDQPDAFQLDPPTYQKWTPTINRSQPISPLPGDTQP